jgi:hypothetical protein
VERKALLKGALLRRGSITGKSTMPVTKCPNFSHVNIIKLSLLTSGKSKYGIIITLVYSKL